MAELTYHLSEKAVERIAEAAIRQVPGCVSLDAKLAGLAGRSLPRVSAFVDRRAGTVALDADVAAIYPSPVAAVTDAAREAVMRHVPALTGLEVTRVNIRVANAKAAAPGEAVSAEAVAAHDTGVHPTPVKVRSSSSHIAPVELPPARAIRSTGLRPPRTPLAPVALPDRPELKAVGYTPAAVTTPRTPAPQQLRPIYVEPVVIAHVPTR